MREMCETAGELEWKDATLVFFEYFERHYLFFSTMLASKGVPSFRNRFLEFLIEEFKNEVDMEKNRGLNEDLLVQFNGTAYVGVVEWWIKNGRPYPPHVMAEQVGLVLERNL